MSNKYIHLPPVGLFIYFPLPSHNFLYFLLFNIEMSKFTLKLRGPDNFIDGDSLYLRKLFVFLIAAKFS